jgi:hypothetical protein
MRHLLTSKELLDGSGTAAVSNVLRAETGAMILDLAAFLENESRLISDMGGGKNEWALAVTLFK